MDQEDRLSEPVRVRRRRVFYIPGYDPIPPRRYRELYRKEATRQAEISGYDISVSGHPAKGGTVRWSVVSVIGGQQTETDIEVLVWSDIVRDSMSGGILATYLQLVRTAWIYISTGTLWRLMQLRKGPVLAALYPVGFLLLQLGLALALALVVRAGIVWVVSAWQWPGGQVAGALAALLAAAFVLRWFRHRDGRFYAYYLMHDYAFSARDNGADPPALKARIAEFADRVSEALNSGVDEVLVVGHSSGAHVGVSVLADLVRSGRIPSNGLALGFLSLGQVVPMVSFLPGAQALRADLRLVSESSALTWVDVSAPGDGCAFALCDPVTVSGVATPAKKWPLVVSAAFTQTLSPERWKALRWRFFRLHFQYLCAFDRPGHYDYFRITAGPQTLAERFAGRAPSASRIEVPVSKHTSVCPA